MKTISFYKEDFPEPQWETICEEFDANPEKNSIICIILEDSILQDD